MKSRRDPRAGTATDDVTLTLCSLKQILNFLDDPFDLLGRLLELLLVSVKILAKFGRVEETVGELKCGQARTSVDDHFCSSLINSSMFFQTTTNHL